jgi:hypothetical protein
MNDWYLTKDIKTEENAKRDEMKKYLEAFIQKYNVTLIKNNYDKP